MSPEYEAQIRKLRLPGQNTLKNEAERCLADPLMTQATWVRLNNSRGSEPTKAGRITRSQ
jgi:hypothetical protein